MRSVPSLPSESVEPFWNPATTIRYDGPGSVVGSDYYYDEVAFVAADDGAVWSIHPAGILRTRFVNSSLDQFAVFLSVVTALWSALTGVDDDEAVRQVDTLVAELQLVDSAAFTDAESYWSVVVEQLRDGLV